MTRHLTGKIGRDQNCKSCWCLNTDNETGNWSLFVLLCESQVPLKEEPLLGRSCWLLSLWWVPHPRWYPDTCPRETPSQCFSMIFGNSSSSSTRLSWLKDCVQVWIPSRKVQGPWKHLAFYFYSLCSLEKQDISQSLGCLGPIIEYCFIKKQTNKQTTFFLAVRIWYCREYSWVKICNVWKERINRGQENAHYLKYLSLWFIQIIFLPFIYKGKQSCQVINQVSIL